MNYSAAMLFAVGFALSSFAGGGPFTQVFIVSNTNETPQLLSVLPVFRESIRSFPVYSGKDVKRLTPLGKSLKYPKEYVRRIPDKQRRNDAYRFDEIFANPCATIDSDYAKAGNSFFIYERLSRPPFFLPGDGCPLAIRESYEQWKKGCPGFIAFNSLWEFDSDSTYLTRFYDNISDESIKKELHDAFRRPDEVGKAHLIDWFREAMRRATDFHFGESTIYPMCSNDMGLEHIFAANGAKGLWYEATTQSFGAWNCAAAFLRGAARQYGLDYCWYMAQYYTGFDRKGNFLKGDTRWIAKSEAEKALPYRGEGRSQHRRQAVFGWLIGAKYMQTEGWSLIYLNRGENGAFVPSENALDLNEIYELAKRTDRGEPYTPLAVLTPLAEPSSSSYNNQKLKEPETQRTIFDTLVPIRGDSGERRPDRRKGEQGCLYNSEFAGFFDVLCPDAGQNSAAFANALSRYRHVLIAGNAFDKAKFDEAALSAFEAKGGKVHRYPSPACDTPERLRELLLSIQSEMMPVSVEGDIQWGVNRTTKGWLVYLINNKGVIKYCDEPEEYDSARTVKVTVVLKASGERRTVEVKPGDFALVEFALSNETLPKSKALGKMNFSPRMVHSASGLDSYPDEYLEKIAKTGVDSILVFISDPPDVTRTGQHENIPALIERAAKYGIGVYAYADFPVKAGRMHPKEEGAREWYDELYGSIVKNAPGLKGLICVGESVAFPYRDHRPVNWWWNRNSKGCRATSSNPIIDWAEWLELVKSVTRKYKPDFEIVFWTYNWYRAPEEQRLALLERIPTDISLLVTFEMGDKPVNRCGLEMLVQDYSITRPGPGTTFRSEAAVAKRRGIRLYSMTNTGGRTWDFGLLPYEPVPWRWKERFEAIRRARATWGLCGLMESHHYGFRPNFISELATRVLADGYKPTQFEGILRSFAVRDYGEENADAVMGAWKDWSDAFEWHSAMSRDQYTVLRNGPVYPLCLPGATLPSPLHPNYDMRNGVPVGTGWRHTNVTFDFDRKRLDNEIMMAEKEIALLESGCAKIAGIERARNQWALGRFMLATIRTLRNAKRYYRAGLKRGTSEMRRIIDEEESNVKGCFDWIGIDPDIGWEPTMGRVVDRDTLEWKLKQLKEARTEIAAIGRDDPFPVEGYGSAERPYTLETGGVGYAAFSMRAVVNHRRKGDMKIRAEAPTGVETEIHPNCILFRADESAPEAFEIKLFSDVPGHSTKAVIPVRRLPAPEKCRFGDYRAVSFYTKPFCWFDENENRQPLAMALREYWESSGWIVDFGMVDFTGAIPYRTDRNDPICRESVDMNGVNLGGPCPSAQLALGTDYFVKRLEKYGYAKKLKDAKIALWDYEPYVLGPLTRGCWCDDCRKGFDPSRTPVEILRDSEKEWVAYRARLRSKVVKMVATAVKKINPEVKFALCTFPMAPSPDKDYEWLKRRGFDHRLYTSFIDIFANMNYPATDMFFGSLKREVTELPVENRMIISNGWYSEDWREPEVVERHLRAAFKAGIRCPYVGPGLDQAQGDMIRRCRKVMCEFAD